MNEKQTHPTFEGVNPGPKIEDKPVIDTTPLPNLHLHATTARLLMENEATGRLLVEDGLTRSTEEARQKAEILCGRAVLQSLDVRTFVEESTEPDNTSYIEDLKEKFESKGKKLADPIVFIEQIYDIRRSIHHSPTLANKIKITDDFKDFVDKTVIIHNVSNSLNNNSRFRSITPLAIEEFRSSTRDRIKKQESNRYRAYRRMFEIDTLIGLGVIEDQNEVRMRLASEAISLLNIFITDKNSPESLNTLRVKQYLKKIDQYRFNLEQEE